MNSENRRGTLDEFVNLCETRKEWNNKDRKSLRELRRSLGSATKIAAVLGVSVQTLYRWERQIDDGEQHQPPPPIKHLRSLCRFLGEEKISSWEVTPRKREDLLQRMKYCENAWVMRSGTPFVLLQNADMLRAVMDNLIATKLQYYFVYRAPVKGGELHDRFFEAKVSFDGLWKKLGENPIYKSALDRVQGVPVEDDNEANKLGLVDTWTSYWMFYYNEEGIALYGRTVDVWQEFVISENEGPEIQKNRLVWLELTSGQAREWRQSRIELLNILVAKANQKHCRRTGI
jgi:hypothetical protein